MSGRGKGETRLNMSGSTDGGRTMLNTNVRRRTWGQGCQHVRKGTRVRAIKTSICQEENKGGQGYKFVRKWTGREGL
jgi:hypothetical protein